MPKKMYLSWDSIKKWIIMAAIGQSNWKLPQELVAISQGDKWPEVLDEWRLFNIEYLQPGEDSQTCLCHHHPIREVCHIKNDNNNNEAIVGNCCIQKFGEHQKAFASAPMIMNAFIRIFKNDKASANEELITFAFKKEAIDRRSYEFYKGIRGRRKLSERQLEWKSDINRRIVKHFCPNTAVQAQIQVVSVQDQAAPVQTHSQVHVIARDTFPQMLADLRRFPKDLASRQLITQAYQREWISQKDYDFYNSLFDRGVVHPTPKQQSWIGDINRRILRNPY